MYSIDWPEMFKSGDTNLLADKKAAINNLKLVLLSCKKELLGDPAFGTALKQYFFEQNCINIRNLVRETIYESILIYVPLIIVDRSDIVVSSIGSTINVTISFKYITDKELSTVDIALTQ